MRKLVLIALAAALAGCGDNEAANNNAVSEETSASDIGPVNDATAIDAATGEAANMAADVNFTVNEAEFNDMASEAANEAGRSTPANNSL